MSEPILCKSCGAEIVYDPEVRTPASAWSAPDDEDPTACVPNAPGHAPKHHPSESTTRVYIHPEDSRQF